MLLKYVMSTLLTWKTHKISKLPSSFSQWNPEVFHFQYLPFPPMDTQTKSISWQQKCFLRLKYTKVQPHYGHLSAWTHTCATANYDLRFLQHRHAPDPSISKVVYESSAASFLGFILSVLPIITANWWWMSNPWYSYFGVLTIKTVEEEVACLAKDFTHRFCYLKLTFLPLTTFNHI